jgi:Zn-dependent protease/CBS domain-containing protein
MKGQADAGGRKQRGISLFKIAGIQIVIDYSWFIIFALIVWSLSAGYFPSRYPEAAAATYWGAGLLAALLFFLSIIIHELSHSLVAVASGIEIPSITLFIFGGVSRLSEEAKDPATELKIAIVGPLSSFALAVVFWLVTRVTAGQPQLITEVFRYLAIINLALGVFNLMPGFPMDGGRVLRAFIWWRGGSLTRATRIASDVGKSFAVVLMILGGVQIFAGALIGGVWLLFIGMFLRGVAQSGYQELVMRQSLEGVRVDEVMIEDVVSVPPDLSLRHLVDDFFLVHGYRGFPVVRDGRPIGVVRIEDVKGVPKEDFDRETVESVMVPMSEAYRIAPDAPLTDALKQMGKNGVGRLIVISHEEMKGMITKLGLQRLVEVRQILAA